MATRREPWFERAGKTVRGIEEDIGEAASKTAAGVRKAGRAAAGAASGLTDITVRTPAKFYAERAREFQRGYSPETPVAQPNAADVARSSARAQMLARKASQPAAETSFSAAPQAVQRVPAAPVPTQAPAPVPAGRVVRDNQGNTMTVSGIGQSSGYYDLGGRQSHARNIRVGQTGSPSPDYRSPQADPQSLSDIAASAKTIGDLVRIRPLMRAAEADQKALLQRQGLELEASAGRSDRALRREQMALGASQAAKDAGLKREQMALGASQAAEDADLRRQQLEQQGAYQQGELELKQEEQAAKQAEAVSERSAEAARQSRLNAALNIYDDPKAPPEVKQRAWRIIEANRGKSSFDPGEKPMTQEAAQKSLQDTWRAVAGNDTPLDPSSIEQLQGVAQANPGAWKAVHGKASPEMVQRYNVLSSLPDAEIAKDPMIASLIKNNGGGKTPEEARVILEALIKKQRGF